MENYSNDLQRWVAEQLRKADLPTFRKLLAYYQQRGGPGLKLAETEALTRNIPLTSSN